MSKTPTSRSRMGDQSMRSQKLVGEIRREVMTWYENATLGSDEQKLSAIAQVIFEVTSEHGIGVDLPQGSIETVISRWWFESCDYHRKQEAYREALEKSRVSDSSARLPREPDPVPSPEDRLSASSGKALQLIEMMLLFVEVRDQVATSNSEFAPLPALKALIRMHHAYTGLYILGLAESFLKLKLSTLDARSKHQSEEELPPVKAPFRARQMRSNHLFSGSTGARFGNWIIRDLARAQAFVFWMKRGAPTVSNELISDQEVSSFDILTKAHNPAPVELHVREGDGRCFLVRPEDGASYVTVVVTEEQLEVEVRRTVRETFPVGTVWEACPPFQLPSANAHLDYGRHNGGARGSVGGALPPRPLILSSILSLLPGVNPTWSSIVSHIRGQALSEQFIPVANTAECDCHSWTPAYECDDRFLSNLRRANVWPREESRRNCESLCHFLDELIEDLQCRDAPARAVELTHTGKDGNWNGPDNPQHRASAKIIGLPEPLKVRTITAGPEEKYYWARFIQKFLHRTLRRHPTFRLIGEPLTLQHIQAMFDQPCVGDKKRVSGDYKSATDLISSRLSHVAADEIADRTCMPAHVRDVFITCLVNHTVTLPPRKGVTGREKERVAPQANGQLMGSPVSFPILCIVNAALTRFSLELENGYRHRLSLRDIRLLINGDDVAFETSARGYEIWKRITSLGGLVFSLGKNFTSQEFLVLNSCMFEAQGTFVPKPMKESRRSAARRYPSSDPMAPGGDLAKPMNTLMGHEIHSGLRRSYLAALTVPSFRNSHNNVDGWTGIPDRVTPRQVWKVTDYQNPDYLGPVGRYVPLSVELSARRTTVFGDLPAMRRLDIKNADGLFKPENYAILPSLQKSWLSNSVGSTRHSLNLLFLRSWKPVLDLAHGQRGVTTFTTDWFLPTSLGGLGLETTDGRGVEASSLASRRLANYLNHHPHEQTPACLPSLNVKSERELVIRSRYLALLKSHPPSLRKPSARVGSQESTEADVLAYFQRSDWLSTAGLEDKDRFSFSRPGKKDKANAFPKSLEKFADSRVRFWRSGPLKRRWMEFPPISQHALDVYVAPIRVFPCQLPRNPRVDLSTYGLDEPSLIFPLIPRSQPGSFDLHNAAYPQLYEDDVAASSESWRQLYYNAMIYGRPKARSNDYRGSDWSLLTSDWILFHGDEREFVRP